MKPHPILSFFLFFLTLSVHAQTVSNLKATFTDCKAEITFDLSDVSSPADLTLWYSGDGGNTWFPCNTVDGDLTGQTTGIGKTITWDNYADNMSYGRFAFKVEAPVQTVGCRVRSSLTDPPYNGWITFMCHNLGADENMTIEEQIAYVPSPNTTSTIDSRVYGDLYQWGRPTDGHEKRTSSTTGTLGTTNTPGHGNFIIASSSPYDWRSGGSENARWGDGTQNATVTKAANDPCPPGWRMPTQAEWASIHGTASGNTWTWNSTGTRGYIITPSGGSGPALFLPAAGFRYDYDGSVYGVGTWGYYWSSTVDGTDSRGLDFSSGYVYADSRGRAYGFSCRCVAEFD